jgi:hypothetical protein
MLPTVTSLPSSSLPAVNVINVVTVEIVVVINIDVAVSPIAIAPGAARPGAKRKSCRAPREAHSGVVSWISIWIIGIRRRTVDHRRIVGRDVRDIGLGIMDDDHLFVAAALSGDTFGLDDLLLSRL